LPDINDVAIQNHLLGLDAFHIPEQLFGMASISAQVDIRNHNYVNPSFLYLFVIHLDLIGSNSQAKSGAEVSFEKK
jgi:hypothetical protein